MKKQHEVFVLFLLSMALFCVSCKTVKGFKGTSDLYGMITSTDNKPVSGFVISRNGKQCAVTNESGLFIVPNTKAGKVIITGEKTGWQSVHTEENFCDRNELFCIQVQTVEEVLVKVESALARKDYDKTLQLLKTISGSAKVYEEIYFYNSVALFKKGMYKQALVSFNKMDKKSRANETLVSYGELVKRKKEFDDEKR